MVKGTRLESLWESFHLRLELYRYIILPGTIVSSLHFGHLGPAPQTRNFGKQIASEQLAALHQQGY